MDWDRFTEQYAGLLWALTVGSALTVLLFITLGARLVARMPPDYFVNEEARTQRRLMRKLPRAALPFVRILRNVVGTILVLLGILLLVLPGQGLLTILAGLILMDFPGKYRAERWLVRRRQVHRSLNWMRAKADQPPLIVD